MSEPLEAIGLAPTTRKKPVRSRSGIGTISWWPNSCHAASCCGIWSTDDALNRLWVRSVRMKPAPWVPKPSEWALGLPE